MRSSVHALILVNAESLNISIVKWFWDSFEFVVCADGGANRLHDGFSLEERESYLPNFIVGDFDSVRPDVSHFYECEFVVLCEICDAISTSLLFRQRGCVCVRDGDQDNNDLDKCMQHIQSLFRCASKVLERFFCVFELDHLNFHSLHVLLCWALLRADSTKKWPISTPSQNGKTHSTASYCLIYTI